MTARPQWPIAISLCPLVGTDQSFVAGCVKLGMDSTFTVNLRLTLELRALCFALEIKFELAGNEAI
jgi:hypothetical protein